MSNPLTVQSQPTQQAPISNQIPPDPFWSSVGQYGVGLAAFLAILKAFADYQLKAAMEDRALKVRENAQSLELEGRVFGSLLSQQESSVASTGQLLNTFIAKTLNQAEVASEQTASLIETIKTLTESIKFLGETQQQQTSILYELKEYSEAHESELTALKELKEEILKQINANSKLISQVLTVLKCLVESASPTNINGEGHF